MAEESGRDKTKLGTFKHNNVCIHVSVSIKLIFLCTSFLPLSRVTYNSNDDESFILTSVGGLEMPGPLEINYPYVPSDTVNTWQLLHWNPSSQKWELSHETCTSESNTYVEDGVSTITVKVFMGLSTCGCNLDTRERCHIMETILW